MESISERAVRSFLEAREIPYQRNYNLPQLRHRKYDFFFTYQKRPCLLEWDGIHHFEEVPHFDTRGNTLVARQEADRLKTRLALEYGFYLIRLDHTCIDSITSHLLLALQRIKTKTHYFSNPFYYTHLNLGVNKGTVIRECEELARKMKLIP